MVMTETLYTIRKRIRTIRWGRMSIWLQFHIFTGIVGPFLVLLHTSWKFNGLAGIVLLLTVIIVISGFIGRYFYTAIPRTIDGIEVETGEEKYLERKIELQRQSASLEKARWRLAVWHTIHIPIGVALFTAAFVHVIGALYYATLIH